MDSIPNYIDSNPSCVNKSGLGGRGGVFVFFTTWDNSSPNSYKVNMATFRKTGINNTFGWDYPSFEVAKISDLVAGISYDSSKVLDLKVVTILRDLGATISDEPYTDTLIVAYDSLVNTEALQKRRLTLFKVMIYQ